MNQDLLQHKVYLHKIMKWPIDPTMVMAAEYGFKDWTKYRGSEKEEEEEIGTDQPQRTV